MNRVTGFKKVIACTAAVVICVAAMTGAGCDVFKVQTAAAESKELQENKEQIDGKQSQIDDLISKQAELDKKIEATKDDINAEQQNLDAIREQIVTVQQTILTLSDSISETKAEVSVLEDSIAEKEIQVEEKHEQIVEGVGDFKVRLRSMYVAGNNSYSDIIVGASDFYDMLMKIELVKRVAEHDDQMIDDLIVLKNQYEADEADLNAQKQSLEAKQEDLENKKQTHEQQRDKLQELFNASESTLETLNNDKQIQENNLAIIEQEQQQFERDLENLIKKRQEIKDEEEKKRQEEERKRQEEERLRQEEERRKQEEERKRQEEEKRKQEEAKKAQAAEGDDDEDDEDESDSSSDSGDTYVPPKPVNSGDLNAAYGYEDKSRFTWPVPGHYNVSFGFGYRNSGSLVGYHGGIDIYDSDIYGAEIVAADDGEVILAENYCTHDFGKNYSCGCGGGYGRYVIIEHDGGYYTLYGHQCEVIVSVGQYVKKGQVIGYVGSTGHSTGPHLHFEVRIGTERQDPSGYV